MSEPTTKFFTYKNRPLVRSGDVIYYGDMGDDYVAMLQILSKKKVEKEEVPDKIRIQIIATDEEMNPLERVKKHAEKTGLYNSLDLAAIWLERALRD